MGFQGLSHQKGFNGKTSSQAYHPTHLQRHLLPIPPNPNSTSAINFHKIPKEQSPYTSDSLCPSSRGE